jgi:hypothetical protein
MASLLTVLLAADTRLLGSLRVPMSVGPIRRGVHRMLDQIAYYAKTVAESVPAIFGIRGTFEQQSYVITEDLGQGLEIRGYGQTVAVEATVVAPTRKQASETAFRLLFAYITGANRANQTIAMTTPVQQTSALIGMTAPVRIDAAATGGQSEVAMRFFLPAQLSANPPVPMDPRVRIVTASASTVAALRYSGNPTEEARSKNEQDMLRRLAATAWQPAGSPYVLNYDPPFAVPFLKRNEIVVEVSRH